MNVINQCKENISKLNYIISQFIIPTMVDPPIRSMHLSVTISVALIRSCYIK